jgi:hydrogenase maturation protease
VNILVAGIGNIFQGDDAFGCEVARALLKRTLPAGVRVVDFGIRGLDLTYALLDSPDLTIFIDAIQRGGEPGTIYTIEPDLENLDTANPTPDPHGMDPVRVLGMVKTMGGQLGRILLVGCEPGDLGGEDGRMGLTEPVSAAIEEAAGIVESLIAKQLEEVII